MVGLFLADNPSPNGAQIEQFQNALPEELSEDVDSVGWHQLVYQIDRAVLNALGDPNMESEVRHALELEPNELRAMSLAIKKFAFFRAHALLKKMG